MMTVIDLAHRLVSLAELGLSVACVVLALARVRAAHPLAGTLLAVASGLFFVAVFLLPGVWGTAATGRLAFFAPSAAVDVVVALALALAVVGLFALRPTPPSP